MNDIRKTYRRLKGIRSSLKAEVFRIEEEIKRGDNGVQSVDEERVKLLAEMKTRLRKEFDHVSGKNSPYRKA